MAQGDILNIIKNRPRNLIINGDFAIDQRNEGNIATPGVYTMDRWLLSNGTTCRRIIESGMPGFLSTGQISCSPASSATFIQRIDRRRIVGMVGKEVTLSFWIRITSGTWGAGAPLVAFTAATVPDNFTVVTNEDFATTEPMDGGLPEPNFNYRRYKVTTTITQNMEDNGMGIQIGNFNSNVQTIRITQVMLAEGVYPVDFERAAITVQGEKDLCLSYFTRLGGGIVGAGYFFGTTNCFANVTFPQKMRVTPVVTVVGSLSDFVVDRAATSAASISVVNSLVANSSGTGVRCNLTSGSPSTIGYGTVFYMNNATYMAVDAEI